MTILKEEQNTWSEKNSRGLLSALSFCVFDLETTGGDHSRDKIIEIGLVKIENLEIREEKSFLIRPEIKIPGFIQKLTSISSKDVAEAPIVEDLIDEILAFMSDSILVAHNISFDVPFFNSVLKRLGRRELENPALCTNLMARHLIPSILNSNLNYMSKIFSIGHQKAHRAKDDARASAELLLKFLDIFIEKKIRKVNQLYYPRRKFELDRADFRIENSKQNTIDQILKTLETLSSAALVVLKDEKGVFVSMVPLKGTVQGEKTLLNDTLHKFEWHSASVRLFGPFIEAFQVFLSDLARIPPAERERLLEALSFLHLNKKEKKDLGSFVIARHLVFEQYIIFPRLMPLPNYTLVFRYPGHAKKLAQFIHSRSARLRAGQKCPLPSPWKDFLEQYLHEESLRKKRELFLFDFSELGVKTKRGEKASYLLKLEDFIREEKKSFDYPLKHI